MRRRAQPYLNPGPIMVEGISDGSPGTVNGRTLSRGSWEHINAKSPQKTAAAGAKRPGCQKVPPRSPRRCHAQAELVEDAKRQVLEWEC